jgi:hypothetical protein
MIFVCKLRINKTKDHLYSILSLSGQSSGSSYRVRQIIVLIKTLSKTKCRLFYIYIIHSLHAGEGNMNKFSYFLYPHAINVLLYRIKLGKHIYRYVKYCWQTYFKSIGTLSQIFKNRIVTVAFKWCVPSASDVFLSKNDNFGGKIREASDVVEYDFYFTEYDFCPVWSRVLIFTHCPIKLIYLW